jgi:2-polyprenyl-3-methyl-5-hydroxy-6-metoxy-1,4-benzoquinol methylase
MYIDTCTSRLKIYERIASGSKVLEIGSGSGILANLLSNKKCRVYCVEKQHNLAFISKNKCVEVLNVDIETAELPYECGFFDCIILGNVLEHLRNPSEILMKLKKYLRVDGSIIYSVPDRKSVV